MAGQFGWTRSPIACCTKTSTGNRAEDREQAPGRIPSAPSRARGERHSSDAEQENQRRGKGDLTTEKLEQKLRRSFRRPVPSPPALPQKADPSMGGIPPQHRRDDDQHQRGAEIGLTPRQPCSPCRRQPESDAKHQQHRRILTCDREADEQADREPPRARHPRRLAAPSPTARRSRKTAGANRASTMIAPAPARKHRIQQQDRPNAGVSSRQQALCGVPEQCRTERRRKRPQQPDADVRIRRQPTFRRGSIAPPSEDDRHSPAPARATKPNSKPRRVTAAAKLP